MPLLLLYLFISVNYLFIRCFSLNMLGPADLVFRAFEQCEGESKDIDVWITQRKFNRTTSVLDIDLTSPWPIDDNIIMELSAEVKKEGGYKPGSFHMKETACELLGKILGDLFSAFLAATGTEDCPIPEGAHKIKDFYLDNEKMTSPQLYGEYRAQAQFWKDEQVKGCFYVYAELVPKGQ